MVRERGVAVAQEPRDRDVHENVLRNWVKELADSASLHSSENITLSKPGLKHLELSVAGLVGNHGTAMPVRAGYAR